MAVGNQLLGAFTATYWYGVWNMTWSELENDEEREKKKKKRKINYYSL